MKWFKYGALILIALLAIWKTDELLGIGASKAVAWLIGYRAETPGNVPSPEYFAPPTGMSAGIGLMGWISIIGVIAMVIMVCLIIYQIAQQKRAMGGDGGKFGFSKSRAKQTKKDENKTRFSDVAGCDEAKADVAELVDFLRDPAKFGRLGGRIPKGVLMVGSPGTGKTLLSRAIAGEANAEFFSLSGSDFVEMYVGVGAGRVRDLFEKAKKAAPAIVFIDEIDAVGRQRGAGVGGGNDEREQTLNALLVEMDGFESNVGVIVIAATNRPDVLDSALLRAGRFDRQVVLPLPDIRGREQILAVHTKKIILSEDVKLHDIARGTPGFTGADLESLTNEAALAATRNGLAAVGMADFEWAKERVIAGGERKSRIISKDERRTVAFHESGHTVVARVLKKYTDPVYKVSIIPRMMAEGVTIQIPVEDRRFKTKNRLLASVAVYYGGRIAEEIFVGDITNGAGHDYLQATNIIREMVTTYAMSEPDDGLGQLAYAMNEGEVFLGRSITRTQNHSEATMQKVDATIKRIADTQYGVARAIIEGHRHIIEAMAEWLLLRETLNETEIDLIMNGKELPPIEVSEPEACSPEH